MAQHTSLQPSFSLYSIGHRSMPKSDLKTSSKWMLIAAIGLLSLLFLVLFSLGFLLLSFGLLLSSTSFNRFCHSNASAVVIIKVPVGSCIRIVSAAGLDMFLFSQPDSSSLVSIVRCVQCGQKFWFGSEIWSFMEIFRIIFGQKIE